MAPTATPPRITRAHYGGAFVPEPPPPWAACMRGDGLGGGSVYAPLVVREALRRLGPGFERLAAEASAANAAIIATAAALGAYSEALLSRINSEAVHLPVEKRRG